MIKCKRREKNIDSISISEIDERFGALLTIKVYNLDNSVYVVNDNIIQETSWEFLDSISLFCIPFDQYSNDHLRKRNNIVVDDLIPGNMNNKKVFVLPELYGILVKEYDYIITSMPSSYEHLLDMSIISKGCSINKIIPFVIFEQKYYKLDFSSPYDSFKNILKNNFKTIDIFYGNLNNCYLGLYFTLFDSKFNFLPFFDIFSSYETDERLLKKDNGDVIIKEEYQQIERKINDACIVSFNFAGDYYKWLIGILPRYYIGKTQGDKYFISHYLAKEGIFNESLKALGICEESHIVSYGQTTLIDKSTFVNIPIRPLDLSYDRSIQYLPNPYILRCFDEIKKNILQTTFVKPSRKIWLSNDSIKNEDLYPILEKFKIDIIDIKKLSFREIVQTFANSILIIGLYDTSLANIVFCSEKSTIIEITNFETRQAHQIEYYTLSVIKKQRYVFMNLDISNIDFKQLEMLKKF